MAMTTPPSGSCLRRHLREVGPQERRPGRSCPCCSYWYWCSHCCYYHRVLPKATRTDTTQSESPVPDAAAPGRQDARAAHPECHSQTTDPTQEDVHVRLHVNECFAASLPGGAGLALLVRRRDGVDGLDAAHPCRMTGGVARPPAPTTRTITSASSVHSARWCGSWSQYRHAFFMCLCV